jgi:hypothetical protein
LVADRATESLPGRGSLESMRQGVDCWSCLASTGSNFSTTWVPIVSDCRSRSAAAGVVRRPTRPSADGFTWNGREGGARTGTGGVSVSPAGGSCIDSGCCRSTGGATGTHGARPDRRETEVLSGRASGPGPVYGFACEPRPCAVGDRSGARRGPRSRHLGEEGPRHTASWCSGPGIEPHRHGAPAGASRGT